MLQFVRMVSSIKHRVNGDKHAVINIEQDKYQVDYGVSQCLAPQF